MFTRPRIIPVLLIDNRDLIKTVNFKKPVYLGDPVNAVKIFNLKDIDELAILDISATKEKKEPDFELLSDIASQAFMPLSYGGGIQNIEQVKKVIATGFEKVVINTSLIRNFEFVKESVKLIGGQSVVASIDVKKIGEEYRCVIADGSEITEFKPEEIAIKAEQIGVGEILINSIDQDGMMNGYDIDVVKKVSQAVSIPVIACGGAGNVQDLKKVISEGGAHAAAGGSMFVFYGRLKGVLINFPSNQELYSTGIYVDS